MSSIEYLRTQLVELKRYPNINRNEIKYVEELIFDAELHPANIKRIEFMLEDAKEDKQTATRIINGTAALCILGFVCIFLGGANLFYMQPAFLGVGIPAFLLSLITGGLGATWIYNNQPFKKYNKINRAYTRALIEGS